MTLTIRKARPEGATERRDGAAQRDGATERRDGNAPEGEVVTTITGSGRPGLHTVSWDLLARKARPRELGGPTTPQELREVLPGTFTVSLKAGSETLSRTFEVKRGLGEKSPGRVR